MNEEYLKGLHTHLGIKDDYNTWINAIQGNEEYLKGLHGHLGVDDDYDTWHSAVLGSKKKDATASQSTGGQGNTSFSYDEYPTEAEIYDLKQGTATPAVVQKATRFISQDREGVDFSDQELQDYNTLKNIVGESVKEEAFTDVVGKDDGRAEVPVAIAGDMSVSGQRGRGEAVDGAPRKAYEKQLQTSDRREDIMVNLQDQKDELEAGQNLLELSDEELDTYFENKKNKKRNYGAETVSDFEDRTRQEKLDRAYEDDAIAFGARTFDTMADFEKSLFESQKEYESRMNKVSDTEIRNAEYRLYQQGLNELQDDIESGALSVNSMQVKDWVKRTAEEIGLDPDSATFESVSNSITNTKNYLEGVLFEKTLDKELYENYQRRGEGKFKDFTYTRRATSDFILNTVNDIAIYAADTFINDPLTAERLQQAKTARNLRTQIELGHDPYDDKGITETYGEELKDGVTLKALFGGKAFEKLVLSLGDSYISLASAMVNPMAGVAVAGTSGTFGTYEAYRDRGDLSESEKQALAWGSGIIEAGITYIGMGNMRRARAAMGVAGEATSTAARKKLYAEAIKKIQPVSKKVAQAMSSARGRGIAAGVSSVLEEQAEELSIGILTQGLAHAIADDEFDTYELADIALSTFAMSGTTMAAPTGYATYSKYRNFENTPTSDKVERFETLKDYYEDLRKAYKEEGISNKDKSIIKDEMLSVKDEINQIKAESVEFYESLSETKGVSPEMVSKYLDITRAKSVSDNELGFVQDVNKAIRQISRNAKNSDSPTVKQASKKKISQLLELKTQIEGSVAKATAKSDPLAEGKTTEAPKQTTPEGTSFETVEEFAQNLKTKLDARKGKETAKETPSQAVDSRVRYLNPATNETVEGVLIKDGQRLAVETDEGNIIDIANFDEVADTKLGELNLSPAEGLLGVNEDGSFTYNRAGGVVPQGTKMVNKNGVKAIRRDKNGNVKNVLLTNEDGSETYNLKGEEAEEAAYQIALKESQTEGDKAKVDEEFRLQAIEDARAEESTEPTQPAQPTQEEAPAQPSQQAKERAARRKQRKNIELVGDVDLSQDNRTVVSNMIEALQIVSPDIKVVMHSSRDSYNSTHSGASRDVGHFNPSTNTVHVLVDGTNPLNAEGYLLLKHEMVHPILEAVLASDPHFANRVENRIKAIMNRYAKGTDAQKRVLDHYERYARRSDQPLELLTEFVTVFSEPAGVKLLSRDKTAFEKVADLFQMIIDRIKGFRDAKVPSSEKEIVDLAKAIGKALKTGSAIDVDKTVNPSRENAVRQSLERSSDPSKAIQPKKGSSPADVKQAWEASKNNFIVAEDFEHSLELRRMGFREAYQKDGKIYMSVPVKYEAYNASSNVAKIKSDSFIKASDVQDKSQKRVYDVLSALSKFSGYKMEFVNRPDLNFDSAMVIPDRENGLNENTVVVNLAYANARTGASGMSMVLVESLRRKAPDAFNELYKNIQESGDSRIKRIFDQYVENAPKEIKNKSDRELIAMANVVQELIDSVTTDAVGQSATEFLADFQEKLADALLNQKEGDLKLVMMPLGENMVLSIESALINKGKGFEFNTEIEVKEKDLIQRLVDRVTSNLRRSNELFERGVNQLLSPIPSRFDMDVQMGGLRKNTILDALIAAGYDSDSDVMLDYLAGANVVEFLATDKQLAEIGKVIGKMIEVSEDPRNFQKIELVFTGELDVSSLNESQAAVHSFVTKIIDYMTSSEKSNFINPDGSFIDGLEGFVIDTYTGYAQNRVTDMMYLITDNYDTAKETKVHFDLMNEVEDIYYDGRNVSIEQMASDFESISFESSLDIFEEVRKKSERQQKVTPENAEKVKQAKTLREAMELANMAVPNVTADGVFVFKVEYDEMKEFFPSKIPKGAEGVFNENAFMEISVIPSEQGIVVSYDVAYEGKVSNDYSDFPSKYGVGKTTMPLVFKYANIVGALTNAKGLVFHAVSNAKHDNIDISEYSDKQVEGFITGEGDPVMRRGLNNIAAARNGHLVSAKLGKDVAFIVDEKVYVTRDKDILNWVASESRRYTLEQLHKDGNSMDIADVLGEQLKIDRPDLVDKLKSKGEFDTKGKSIVSAALAVNENSYVLPQSENLPNNAPMQAAYENDQKYVSSSAVRSMLTPADKTGKKTLDAVDKMFENAEERIAGSGKKGIRDIVKKYFSREALVVNSARLQKAMERGFADFIKAQFTALNGQRANADRVFQKIEKRIFGGLDTTQETILDKIIFLRRVIQIDSNWDNRLKDNQISLDAATNEVESLKSLLDNAKSKKDKDRIKKRIKSVNEKVKYFQSQVDKYSNRPLHPTDGTQDVNLESATAALEQMKQDLGDGFNELSSRADAYFDEYRKILQESFEAGLIDEATRDLFIKDEYQPRVFLEKMFGETPTAAFENMGLEADQIAGIKDGSTGEIFTDARYLLNLSLRSLKHKAASNELFAAMDEQASDMQYKMKDDTVREANYKKDKEGNIIEDGFGNKAVEKADEGYKNVFYRKNGQKRAFQIKTELWNQLHGVEDRSLLTPTQKRRLAKASGTTAKKALVTGLRPAFALIATARGFVEVTRGRGTYDQFKALPVMQVMAMVDFIKSLPDAVLDGKVTEDYFAHGGGMSFLTNQGRPEQIYKKKRSTVRRLLGKYSPFKAAGKALGFAGEKAEIALRLAIYQRTLENLKKTRPELTEKQRKYLAVEDARMIADFSQGGWLTKDLDAVKPYINAAVQGTRGTLEYARKNPKMFVAKQVQAYVMNTALTLMGMMALGKDDWDKLPAYIKNRYNLIPTFLTGKDYKGNERPLMLRLPKAHQFMFLDRLAGITAEALYHQMNDLEYDWKMYDENGYLSEEGFEIVDAFLGQFPAGDLIPEEIFTPKKLSGADFLMQIVSTVPLGGALDAYGNNVDRYRDKQITYDYGKVSPSMEGYKDGRTRDMFKLFSKLTGASAPRSQAAFEKFFAPETSQIVSFIYQMTDAMIVTEEEREGAQLIESKKKGFDKTFGIKKSFQYVVPKEKFDINRKKISEDLDKEEENKKLKIRKEIGIMLKNQNFDYKTASALPKDVQGFIKDLDPAYIRYAAGYAKNRAKGMETDPFFFDVAYSSTAVSQAAKLRLEYGFEKWTDLPADVREDIKRGLFEAGLKNTSSLMQELK